MSIIPTMTVPEDCGNLIARAGKSINFLSDQCNSMEMLTSPIPAGRERILSMTGIYWFGRRAGIYQDHVPVTVTVNPEGPGDLLVNGICYLLDHGRCVEMLRSPIPAGWERLLSMTGVYRVGRRAGIYQDHVPVTVTVNPEGRGDLLLSTLVFDKHRTFR